jgi:glycosyltransferase involved in cell wall biosynthesis
MNDVSIIIPVYNDISIIKNLQTKILYLSSRYRQLIIIDDCSVDYTYLEIINFISHNKLKNIEVILNKENAGPSFSRNIGIKKSVGEYIAFLDSDDDWHPEKIELQISIMKKNNITICGTTHKVIDKENLQKEKLIGYDINHIPFKKISWPKILFISPFATPSVVLHKSLKSYLFDENIRYSEDYNLWKRITYFHDAIKIELPLTYTFKHDYLSSKNTLSGNIKKMQEGVNKSFIMLLKSKEICHSLKLIIIVALIFSQIKYLRRALKKNMKKYF